MADKKINLWLFCIISMMLLGCTKPIDLDQAKDLSLTPVVESSLFFYKGKAGEFFIGGSGAVLETSTVNIAVFDDAFVQDNLVKAEFLFETTNTINRAYSLQVDFLDGLGAIVHSIAIETPASPRGEELLSTHTELFEGNNIQNLKSAKQLEFTLTMLPGIPINEGTFGEINLKSSGTFYLEINP